MRALKRIDRRYSLPTRRRSPSSRPALLLVLCLGSFPAFAAGPRVLPEGQLPQDQRLQPLQDLNGYFPFTVSPTPQAWHLRAEQIRRQMLVSQGLWPLPKKTPLKPVIHSLLDQGDYTIEKAYFESFPGFYVTGSLYRPKHGTGKKPAVLCPHGHWSQGRFYDNDLAAVKTEIEQEAEASIESGRSPLQSRCVQLARLGCVVFHYDMIGYADCQQISFDLAHRFATQRPEMNAAENWGLFSPQAESQLQSVMGLQTYNSIRAIDFVSQLEDVDPSRIGVTGASGGGTQTFMVSALDPRVTASMPCVMVSTAMQGGCTCENSSCLRVGMGNIHFAAMFAPKPLGLTAADDWTKEMVTKGFPELQQHFQMLGAADNLMLHSRVEFGHNYNLPSRQAMYAWFNEHLQLGSKQPTQEGEFPRLSSAEMTVWDAAHPQPAGGDKFETALLATWHDDAQRQLHELIPTDTDSLAEFRQVVGGGIDAVVGRGLSAATELEYERTNKWDRGDFLEIVGLVRNKTHHEELPMAFFYPSKWAGDVAIWLDARGKSALYDAAGQPVAAVQQLLQNQVAVVAVDLLYQGEFLATDPPQKTRRVENPREAAAYTFGYNATLFARRVHDVLTTISFVQHHEEKPQHIFLVGLGKAGPWAAAALAQAGHLIDRAAIETAGFRFHDVTDLHSPDFLPGGAKYFDLPGMLSLAAPTPLLLAGESAEGRQVIAATYQAAGAAQALQVAAESPSASEVASWLLTQE